MPQLPASLAVPSIALILFAAAPPLAAQPAITTWDDLHAAASEAMGSEDVQRIAFSGEGWEACLGQPWRISEGWARWELSDYVRVIDYGTGNSVQSAQRRAGMDPGRLGGCGAQPDAMPSPQQSSITPATSWPAQLPLWLTPQGFLELADNSEAAVDASGSGWVVSFTTNHDGVMYPFTGWFDDELLLERIETRIDDTVFGDMLVEAEFGAYQEFDGLRFPTMIVHRQGGFPVLSLDVSGVVPNTTATAEAVPRQGGGPGGGGGQAQPEEAVTQVGPGIYVSHGAYQSVFVDMDVGVVVIDGLQNDARSAQIIAQVKATLPGKNIRYVISTHNHFDHAGGLRAFVAEGATLITHKLNEGFFLDALSNPRTLANTDPQNVPVSVLGVGDFFSLSDTSVQIHLYKLDGSPHADDMLIAYLPTIDAVVEADLLQPWINPVFSGDGSGPHPSLVHLADELERLDIDYTQFIPVHRPPDPPFMPKAALMTAVDGEE